MIFTYRDKNHPWCLYNSILKDQSLENVKIHIPVFSNTVVKMFHFRPFIVYPPYFLISLVSLSSIKCRLGFPLYVEVRNTNI